MNRRHIVGGLVGAVVGAAIGSRASGHTPNEDRAVGDGHGRRTLPNVVVQTHEGRQVRFYDDLIKAKTVLISFMYTACQDDCPLTMTRLAQVQRSLGVRSGRDVFIYAITVDPEHDTQKVLARYAQQFGAQSGWLFLTGTLTDIKQLRQSFGDDPQLSPAASNHLNLISMGIEPLARWSTCPAWTKPQTIIRYLAWMEPNGARP